MLHAWSIHYVCQHLRHFTYIYQHSLWSIYWLRSHLPIHNNPVLFLNMPGHQIIIQCYCLETCNWLNPWPETAVSGTVALTCSPSHVWWYQAAWLIAMCHRCCCLLWSLGSCSSTMGHDRPFKIVILAHCLANNHQPSIGSPYVCHSDAIPNRHQPKCIR